MKVHQVTKEVRGYPHILMDQTTTYYTLGIDIGSTTVKVALLDQDLHIIFSDYERHYANIQETLAGLLKESLKPRPAPLILSR